MAATPRASGRRLEKLVLESLIISRESNSKMLILGFANQSVQCDYTIEWNLGQTAPPVRSGLPASILLPHSLEEQVAEHLLDICGELLTGKTKQKPNKQKKGNKEARAYVRRRQFVRDRKRRLKIVTTDFSKRYQDTLQP